MNTPNSTYGHEQADSPEEQFKNGCIDLITAAQQGVQFDGMEVTVIQGTEESDSPPGQISADFFDKDLDNPSYIITMNNEGITLARYTEDLETPHPLDAEVHRADIVETYHYRDQQPLAFQCTASWNVLGYTDDPSKQTLENIGSVETQNLVADMFDEGITPDHPDFPKEMEKRVSKLANKMLDTELKMAESDNPLDQLALDQEAKGRVMKAEGKKIPHPKEVPEREARPQEKADALAIIQQVQLRQQ